MDADIIITDVCCFSFNRRHISTTLIQNVHRGMIIRGWRGWSTQLLTLRHFEPTVTVAQASLTARQCYVTPWYLLPNNPSVWETAELRCHKKFFFTRRYETSDFKFYRDQTPASIISMYIFSLPLLASWGRSLLDTNQLDYRIIFTVVLDLPASLADK